MKKFLTILLATLFTSLLYSQSTLEISGQINDLDGEGVEGVEIFVLLDSGTSNDAFTVSDEDGFYSFSIAITDDLPDEDCFSMYAFDCDGTLIQEEDCYDIDGNMVFEIDMVYCTSGVCSGYIYLENVDTALYVLSVLEEGSGVPSYSWSNGEETQSINIPFGLEGTYCVTVTYADGCTFEDCFELIDEGDCSVFILESPTANSSVLFAIAWGGSDELDYTWNDGSTQPFLEVEESGDYCVTISDNNGCSAEDCLTVTIDSTGNADCFGFINSLSSDTLNVLSAVFFGVEPYTYAWSGGETTPSIATDGIGQYCVTVTDAEGCQDELCYNYDEWADCWVWIGCDPIEGGAELVAIGFGEGDLSYLWNTGEETEIITVFENGDYCVTVTDAEGCVSEACVTIDLDEINDCFTPIDYIIFNDSIAQLTVPTNPDLSFSYLWSTSETTQTITVSQSGVYCVDVIGEDNDCVFSTCIEIQLNDIEICDGWVFTSLVNDSIAVLDVYGISIDASIENLDALGYSFLWDTGDTTSYITVTEEGDYCVTVTSPGGCVFEACGVYSGFCPIEFPLYGQVYDVELDLTISADIELYRTFSDGTIELVAETVAEQGGFFFDSIPHGFYIALATAHEEGQYAPTYGLDAITWEEATAYFYFGGDFVEPLLIEMVPIVSVDGIGSIGGIANEDGLITNEKEEDIRNTDPIADANVMLKYEGQVVGQVYSGEDGSFFFENLPLGTYEVILEIPGAPAHSIEVVLTEENPHVTNINIEIDAGALSTEEMEGLLSYTVYPNPTANYITAEFDMENNVEGMIRIIDNNGQVRTEVSAILGAGNNQHVIDVNDLPPGVYSIVFIANSRIATSKFIKI